MAAVSEQTARVAPVQLSGQLIQVDCCPAAFLPGQGAELQVQEEVHPLPSISSVSLSLSSSILSALFNNSMRTVVLLDGSKKI